MATISFLVLLLLAVANGDIAPVKIWENEQFTITDMRNIYRNYRGVPGVSTKCTKQLDVLMENTSLLMTLLDASSKFPYTGLGYVSKLNYGNLDQCFTVDHKYNGGRILGEHCTVGMVIPDLTMNTSDTDTYFRLSVCRPNHCNSTDLQIIANNVTSGLNLSLPVYFVDSMCHTKETYSSFTHADIATLHIFGICIFLMVVSTIYDVRNYYTRKKNAHPLLTAFSVLSNGRKLLHISPHSKSKEQIETFHGLRVISMMWIVAGHGFVAWTGVSVINRDTVDTWLQQPYAGYIQTAPLAVDTFFFMSGFLLAFQYLKGKPRSFGRQVVSVPTMIIHRYLRLTPAMLMIFLAVISIFTHLGDGPLWDFHVNLADSCRKNWWAFFLYIQNYYNNNDLCITQTWYLSADMQMFILAPLVLIPVSLMVRRPSMFRITMAAMLVLNIFFTFLPLVLKFAIRSYENDYDTHSRLINYFIGMMLGVFMREKIDKPFLYIVRENQKPLANLVIWCVMILGMLTTVICYQEVEMNHGWESKTVFYSLMRPAWCIGLSWITYSCYHGYGGVVSWLLCRPIYQILGRLTYCIYLVHGSVVMFYTLSTRVPWYFTDYNAFYLFCGHYFVSVVIATFWTLAFESPLIIVEKFLMGGYKRQTQSKPTAPPVENVEEGSKKNEDNNESKNESHPTHTEPGAYRRHNEIY